MWGRGASGHQAEGGSCVYRGQGDVILGWVGGGLAAEGLCFVAGGGEQVVALRSRSIIQTGGVSLLLFLSPQSGLTQFPPWSSFCTFSLKNI